MEGRVWWWCGGVVVLALEMGVVGAGVLSRCLGCTDEQTEIPDMGRRKGDNASQKEVLGTGCLDTHDT